MFSKRLGTEALLKTNNYEGQAISFNPNWAQYYNLPNNRLLFILKTVYEKTLIRIRSANDLEKIIYEKELDGNLDLIGIFPDGSFLLTNHILSKAKTCLLKISSEEVKVLSSQDWDNLARVGIINSEQFFSIKRDLSSPLSNPQFFISLFSWNEKESQFIENPSKITISTRQQTIPFMHIYSVNFLGSDRYLAHCGVQNAFFILIFSVDFEKNTFHEIATLHPQAPVNGTNACGKSLILPNGQLITYFLYGNNVQLWDLETFRCIKKWDWSSIRITTHTSLREKGPITQPISQIRITPFPDSLHLLIDKGSVLYLFNMKRLTLKTIQLAEKTKPKSLQHILEDGTVIRFIGNEESKEVHAMHFDLRELQHYRETLELTKCLFLHIAKKAGLPWEITKHIFSYAYTPQAKQSLASKLQTSQLFKP